MKLLVAGALVLVLGRSKLLDARNLLVVAGLWLTTVACLAGLLCGLFPLSLRDAGASIPPAEVLVPLSILAVPLARPIAAPLAVAWNRHR